MKNRINVTGVIMPSDWDYMREWVSPISMTFPASIAEALAEADPAQDLELYIDSPGGYIDAGRSMIALIQDWATLNNRKVNVTVGGLAASMAAVMMVAFNGRIAVSDCTMVMFHAAKTAIWDDVTAGELRDVASALDIFNAYAAKVIARRTGLSEDEAAAMIDGRKESYFGAEDLITANLADEIIGVSAAAPVQLPSATAVKAFAHKMSAAHNDVGGLLAAVALATVGANPKPKGKNMTESNDDQAVNESETVEVAQTAEDTPAETETETAEETETTESESEEAAEEETEEESSEETETETETETEIESEEVTNLRAEVARAQAAEKAAVARAEAAEKALHEKKQATISAALTPRAEKKPVPANPGTAWREAVAACGGNIVTAAQKHPELYAAISKH